MSITNWNTTFRRAEIYHSIRVPDNVGFIVRLDGRSFSSLTKNLEHPFDIYFHRQMCDAALQAISRMEASYATVHSDEISIYFSPQWSLFDREIEKTLSLSASAVSVAFSTSNHTDLFGEFDARVVLLSSYQECCQYFLWRQDDAYRCFLNSLLFWTYVKNGFTKRAATKCMMGISQQQSRY